MALDPQFRTVLDTFEVEGLVLLVRGDVATTRAHPDVAAWPPIVAPAIVAAAEFGPLREEGSAPSR